MPLRDLTLFVDKDSNRLVQGFESAVETFLPGLVLGDTIPVRARFLTRASQSNERLWDEVDVSDYVVRLAIGVPAAQPVGGVFTITYDGDTTSELAYNASGATVQTALNLLASIISAGGVAVTKTQNGAYRISFDDPGVRTAFTTDNSNLYPSTETYSATVAEGTVSVRHIAVVKLETQPAAYSELTTEFPVAAASVVTIRTGAVGIGEIRSFTLAPEPYDGSFSIEVDGQESGAIAHDAEIGAVQSALEALSTVGPGNVTVSGQFPFYTASFAASLEALTTFTVDVSGLIAPTGKSGTLSLNQAGLIELLDGASSVAAILEIELYDTVELSSYTVLQKSVTILDDVIGNEPSAETGGPAYLTAATLDSGIAARAVLYDRAQTLTSPQQTQARGNLGLGTAATSDTGDFATTAHTHTSSEITDLPAATISATPNTLVLRDADGGGVEFSSSGVPAVSGYSNAGTGLDGYSNFGTGVNGYSDSGTGVYGNSNTGFGLDGNSTFGTGVNGYSDFGSGVSGNSNTGNHADFGGGKFIIANNGDTTFTGNVTAPNLVTLAGAQTLSNKTHTLPTINGYTEGVTALGTVISSATINITAGTIITAKLTASTACTFTMPTAAQGLSFMLHLAQATTTGNGTATFQDPSLVAVDWGAAGTYAATATAGKLDILSFVTRPNAAGTGWQWAGSYLKGQTPT